MPQIHSLKKERKDKLDFVDNLIASVEETKRQMTPLESRQIETKMQEVEALNVQIKTCQVQNTIRNIPEALLLGGGGLRSEGRGWSRGEPQKTFTEDYASAFFEYLSSNGQKLNSALYEGSNTAGGYAVPIVVDDQIVPLAPQEMAIRRLATVIPTTSDIKIPTKESFSVAALKTELSSFASTAPTIGQLTLSAFMVGQQNDISWELLQDVPVIQSFVVTDMVLAQQMYEESLYVSGSASGQPQGLIGNVGVGVVEEADTNGNLVTINGCLDLIGKLNAIYHPGASWVMQRATSIILRKAQAESNLFYPAFTRVGAQDFLFGYPVEYVTDMPAATRGNTPIIFGDFKRGYLIGDRGGSGINVKVLDQPKAAQGIVTLLTYRRTDGRVRLPEALQPYYIAAS